MSGLGAAAAVVAVALLTPRGELRSAPETGGLGPKVVLVRMAALRPGLACAPTESMLADEIDATALEFEVVDAAAGDEGGGAERLAVRLGARQGAALRVTREPAGAACALELWVQGSGTSEAVYRKIRLPAPADRDAAMNAALEAAEAVFAGLVELRLISEEALRSGAPEPQTPVPVVEGDAEDAGVADAGPSAPARAGDPGSGPPPPALGRRLGLGLGAGVAWSPGGVGPRGAVRLAFDGRVVPWLTLRLDAWVTVIGSDLKAHDAQATFDAASFRLTAFYEFVRSGVVRPALGVGGGGIVVWSTGVGAVRYVGGQEMALAGWAGGAGRVAVVLGKWVRVELGAAVGAVIPEVRVRFAGESVARFGRPLVEGFASVELSFF